MLVSCKRQPKEPYPSLLQVELIDSLYRAGDLVQKIYPDMSVCGGSLVGFYRNGDLMLMDANYNGEQGRLAQKVYWNKEQIIQIKYDIISLGAIDTSYVITLGERYTYQRIVDGKVVSRTIDGELVEELISCSMEMRRELNSK